MLCYTCNTRTLVADVMCWLRRGGGYLNDSAFANELHEFRGQVSTMRFDYFLSTTLLFALTACSTVPVIHNARSITDLEAAQAYELNSLPIPIEILEARVGFLPSLVKVRDKQQLTYELNLANGFHYPMRLKQIEIVDPKQPEKILHTFDADYLEQHLLRPGIRSEDSVLDIGANQFGIAYLQIDFVEGQIPMEFFHRLTLDVLVPEKQARPLSLELARTTVPDASQLVIAPPVRSGIWLYEAEPHWVSRELSEGSPSSAQRFAIDFVKIDGTGGIFNDGLGPNSKYITYGEPLLAVADGSVLAVKDGLIENDPSSGKLAVPGSRETMTGNYIVLDIGNDVVAVYAHLQPGSLTVNVGDQVKRGDQLGLLGNSGNSSLPHLHFHLETKTGIHLSLSGEGIPYQFERFNQVAIYTIDDVEKAYHEGGVDTGAFRQDQRMIEFPAKNGVVVFE